MDCAADRRRESRISLAPSPLPSFAAEKRFAIAPAIRYCFIFLLCIGFAEIRMKVKYRIIEKEQNVARGSTAQLLGCTT